VNPKDRTLEELERQIVVRGGKRLCRILTTYFHHLTVLTSCPIPARGGGILVCNHTSSLDPVPLQAACPRLITWMMAREYGEHFGTRWFFNAIDPILVDRSGRDMAATRAALRALKDGKILGLFPEGRIEKSPELMEFQTGAALLAMKSETPIYPAYLDGSQRCKGMVEAVLVPNRITLAFGPPIYLKDEGQGREGLEKATLQIRSAIQELADEQG
jgi:1-acyl-sn-glycerol-3-phosphate acyltransferase